MRTFVPRIERLRAAHGVWAESYRKQVSMGWNGSPRWRQSEGKVRDPLGRLPDRTVPVCRDE